MYIILYHYISRWQSIFDTVIASCDTDKKKNIIIYSTQTIRESFCRSNLTKRIYLNLIKSGSKKLFTVASGTPALFDKPITIIPFSKKLF